MTAMGGDRRATVRVDARQLPAWPLLAGMVGFPVWWVAGLVDLIWIGLALVMLGYLARARNVVIPRGTGLWFAFLVLVVCSAIMLPGPGPLVVWAYRFLQYAAAGVIAVYVYNARQRITTPVIVGSLVSLWLTTVAGGYLGVLFPDAVYRTPMSYVVPQGLLSNDLFNHMVIRRFAQYNPEGYFQLSPRPSAPYHYTNNWGLAFSILTPFVLAAIVIWRRRRRAWLLALALPVGLYPAFMTLNRGMFIGLALAGTYIAIRQAVRGNGRALLLIAALGVVAASVYTALPTEELLAQRLEGSSTTEDRASLYRQAIDAVQQSPILGYGAPQESEHPGLPPVGTQGQLWMVLVSHGPLALACFVGWMFMAWLRSVRRHELVPMVANAGLLVSMVQIFFYGLLPHGLPVIAVLIGTVLRPPRPAQQSGSEGKVVPTTIHPSSSRDSVRMLSERGLSAPSATTRPR
jgi:hypothetical protein